MRRLQKFFAGQNFIFVAPTVAVGSATISAKTIAIHPAACMVDIAGIDLSAAVGVILDRSVVALDLTFYRRGSLTKLFGNRTDRMTVVEPVFDLSAVFEGKVRALTFISYNF